MSLKNWKEIPAGGLIVNAGNSKDNKTGSWRSQRPNLDAEKCIRCQKCVGVCPEQVITSNKDKDISIDYDYCKGCGLCADVCPKKAIKME